MALIELIEKSADADLVREMLGFAAGRLMEAEVQARTGAAHGVRDPARQVQRNGYRERPWETRAGRIELEIPWLRRGSYFSTFLEPRRTAEKVGACLVTGQIVVLVDEFPLQRRVEALHRGVIPAIALAAH
jgi:transposase-like protein